MHTYVSLSVFLICTFLWHIVVAIAEWLAFQTAIRNNRKNWFWFFFFNPVFTSLFIRTVFVCWRIYLSHTNFMAVWKNPVISKARQKLQTDWVKISSDCFHGFGKVKNNSGCGPRTNLFEKNPYVLFCHVKLLYISSFFLRSTWSPWKNNHITLLSGKWTTYRPFRKKFIYGKIYLKFGT